jgi:hypothetical protein
MSSNYDLSDGAITFSHPTPAYLFPRSTCPLGIVVNRIVFSNEIVIHGDTIRLYEHPYTVARSATCHEREISLEDSPWSSEQVYTTIDLGLWPKHVPHGTTTVHFVHDNPVHGTDVTTLSYLGDKLTDLRVTQCETDWGNTN